MTKFFVHLTLLCALIALEAVSSAPTIVRSISGIDTVAKESQRIHANIHGKTKLLMDDANSRPMESPREGRSKYRKEASAERYPSPDGKDARWRFDLRHTVDAEMSHAVRGSLASYQSPTKAVLQRGILRAHVI
jgi:hypothetical protein